MIIRQSFRLLVTGAMVASLSACFGNSTATPPAGGTTPPAAAASGTPPATGGGTPPAGGGTPPAGGTSTLADFNTKAVNYIFLVPTSAPITGSAA